MKANNQRGVAGCLATLLAPMRGERLHSAAFLLQPKLKRYAREYYPMQRYRLLDVGCGNHSATITKRWFPNCEYWGVDKDIYNNSQSDLDAMFRFLRIDLDGAALDEIPDDYFDYIVAAHVIEHMITGLDVLGRLAYKLRAGGAMYVEFPSSRSLALPSAEGTLNFCDDETHVRVYDVKEVANALLANGLLIVRAGRCRSVLRMLMAPAIIVRNGLNYLVTGRLTAYGLWYVVGFADYVYAKKP